MRPVQFACASILAAGVVLAPVPASAQDPQALRQEIDQLRRDFDALKQQYGDRLTALEAKLATTEGTPPVSPPSPAAPQEPTAPVPPGAAGAGGPTGSLPVYGGSIANSKIFNPDVAVIGDFLGALGSNHVNPPPALQMPSSIPMRAPISSWRSGRRAWSSRRVSSLSQRSRVAC